MFIDKICNINESKSPGERQTTNGSRTGERNKRKDDTVMKKMIALLLALVLALSLAACGNNPANTDEPQNTPANALEKIKADGVLSVALSPDFSPMEFVDSSKTGQEQFVGFDVMLAQYIAESLGVELVIEPMSFDACQSAVYTASVPMSISGYSWTEERAENYELSDYYYAGENETEQVLLIRAADAAKYTKAEDFNGLDVGAQNASLQMQLVTEQLADANPIAIGDITVGVMELKSGNIEALAVAKGNADMIIDAHPDLMICEFQFEVKAEYEANVILITKGETELLEAVNAALAKAYAEGMYGPWYEAAVELGKSENAAELTLE